MAVPTTTLILLHFIYVLAVNAAYQNITVRMNDTRLEYYAMIVVGSGWNEDVQTWTTHRGVMQQSCGGFVAARTVGESVSLVFNGTTATVNLLADQEGSASQVLLDGTVLKSLDTTDASASASANECKVIPVTAGSLSPGPHNLTVVQTGPLNPLFIHSFEYTGEDEASSYSSDSRASSGTPSQSDKAPSTRAPLVGGLIGGMMTLLTGLLALFLKQRRRRPPVRQGRPILDDESNVAQAPLPSPVPYTLPPNPFADAQLRVITVTNSEKVGLDYPASPICSPATQQQLLHSMGDDSLRAEEAEFGTPATRLDLIQSLVDRGVPADEVAAVIRMVAAGEMRSSFAFSGALVPQRDDLPPSYVPSPTTTSFAQRR